ncbi:AMP-binding protein [Flavobacterium sp. 123]|jgi:O-succinylbenzoic acid--CoA ligase|uniref:AMP-binding protein n=1 Tax=Flavobacterium sp. 123 TaxID=2135627 RepID=UPI000EB4892C|nr:AMP-binding protein [Flavobacterium sp. 123]RKT00489.1 O-succinylbenzoic acid--CoA ligase [Flavobacterium sp. 123]
MNNPTYHNVHNKFKLNGYHLTKEDLIRVAYSFIKEGDYFEKPLGVFILDWFDDRSYLEINTSGSTGTPKIIQVEKQAMVNSALATGDFFGLEPGKKILHCLPTNYVAGKMMFVRAFILGLEMEFVAPSSNPLEGIDETFDFCGMVPLQAKNSLKDLHKIKKLIIGGVKVHKSLEQELVKLPIEIYETYGMTETITHIAAKKIGEEAFTVLPNVTVSVDERHCLVIDAKNISEEKIVTNDIVKIISDTQFVWVGRYDNVINSGGIKLIPEQIEEKLSTLIPRRYFVFGESDATLGEKLVLYIEGEPIKIDESVFDVLDKYERPKEVKFIPSFKQTATGKIIRSESLDSIKA